MNSTDPLLDRFSRPLRDLRISVTDRCNFRCIYCMPRETFDHKYKFLNRDKLLSFEEIRRLAAIFASLGVRKFRLTGGEPLMRRDLEKLIATLAAVPGVDLGMTTNGSFPLHRVASLKAAGLNRITVSLDSLDEATFKTVNDVKLSVRQVLAWIDACADAGMQPVKINMVVKRGANEDSILPMARYFRERGHILRFIEFMDVGATNGWRMDDVVPAAEIAGRIRAEFPLEPAEPNYRGEVAKRWRYRDGKGEIGLIASVTQPFCGDCSRLRLSADGSLFTCLFATQGTSLRDLIRSGATDDEVIGLITSLWRRREDRYSEIRSEHSAPARKVEMSYIGG